MSKPLSAYPALVLGPAHEAVNYEWYQDRLAEPTLADRGIAISLFRLPLLAVPVGGHRLGGYYSAPELPVAIAVRDALVGEPGFPNIRVRWSAHPDACHTVGWGAPDPPSWDDVARGRFYGYSDVAISTFLRDAALRSSRALLSSCSS